jgi:hypothetical protein
VAGDDSLGVLLKEAQELLGSRKVLAIEDAAAGLSDPLIHQRQEMLEMLLAPPSALSRKASTTLPA